MRFFLSGASLKEANFSNILSHNLCEESYEARCIHIRALLSSYKFYFAKALQRFSN